MPKQNITLLAARIKKKHGRFLIQYFHCGCTILPVSCCSSIRKNVSIIYFQAASVLPCCKKMVLRHKHPVRLFPRNKTSGELAPPAEQPPTAESGRIEKHEIAVRTCNFCLQTPCISLSAFKPMGCGAARITNHTKHRKNYKWFWRTLKECGQYLVHSISFL